MDIEIEVEKEGDRKSVGRRISMKNISSFMT